MWAGLKDESVWAQWDEPNRLKWLFRDSQKWSVTDARDVVQYTWNMLDYS
jgi:hypothetical protein